MRTPDLHIRLRHTVDDSYPIFFVRSTAQILSDIRGRFGRRRVFLLTDSNVARHHARNFYASLRKHVQKCHLITIPAGERSKSRGMKERIENDLIKHGVSRDSLLIAMGGGMIGDIGGFTAATVLRGIEYIQIPTSLMAQVDSSIGGKVAVDHPKGKNLIGAYYQPKAVYISVRMLRTLSEEEYVNGLAEVIKYGAILDKNLFRILERRRGEILDRNIATLTVIVRRCCQLKKSVVETDEKERGLRRLLNFGHTIGHAIEQCSGYRLRHGEAIAIGMVKEAQISQRLGLIRQNDYDRLRSLLAAYNLPLSVPHQMKIPELLTIIQTDKKISMGKVHYTLLRAIGEGIPGIQVQTRRVAGVLRK